MEHVRVLEQHGLTAIASVATRWWENPAVWVLLAREVGSGDHVGAVRLQRWGNGIALPIEMALAKTDPRVGRYVASFADQGVGELCGLWCAPRIAGRGFAAALTRMGLAVASHARTRTLFSVCDEHQVSINLRLGFRRSTALADEGRFEYPRPGLIAQVIRVGCTLDFADAEPDHRRAMLSYRAAPIGEETCSRNGLFLTVHRDLALQP